MKHAFWIVCVVTVLALDFPLEGYAAVDSSTQLLAEVVDGDTILNISILNIEGLPATPTAIRFRVYDENGVKICDQNAVLGVGIPGTPFATTTLPRIVNYDLCVGVGNTPLTGPGSVFVQNVSNAIPLTGEYIRMTPGYGRFQMSAWQGGTTWTAFAVAEFDITSVPGFPVQVECNGSKLQQAIDIGFTGPANTSWLFVGFGGFPVDAISVPVNNIYRNTLTSVNATFAAQGGTIEINGSPQQLSCIHWVGNVGKKFLIP